jgi:nucleotide-binding universal stress UspA family protein
MAHILLPTDFSHHALNACAYALDLYGSEGNVFTLVHSYVDPVAGYADVVEMGSAFYAASVEGLALFTERFRSLPGGADAQVFSAVEYGPLAKALQRLCTSKGADLIVMGTTGAAGFSLFGSNAADVAKASAVPVLIVPKDAHYQGLQHILLADDMRGVEPEAMRSLVTLALNTGAHITIAHVLRNEAQRPDAMFLAEFDDILADVPYTYTEVRDDDVAQALSTTAERQNMDLVAVLHRHTGLLDSLFHASVAKQLAMHSSIPLLVLEG